MDPLFVSFKTIVSPYMPWLGVAMVASFWIPSLYAHFGGALTWSTIYDTNPCVIRPMSLVVSLFYAVVSPCYNMNVWKASRRAENSLDILSTTFELASSHVLGDLSIFYVQKPTCPLFIFSADSKEESRNAHLHLIQTTSESQYVQVTPPLV